MAEESAILIVEDEIIVAADLQERLRRIGYGRSLIVTSGEDALEKLGEFHAELVLMDIGLKGELDGIETALRIRDGADIPVVYLTAYADEETLERAEATEPYGYLVKPVGERELHSTVKMARYKHRMEKKLRDERERFRVVADYTLDWEYWWKPGSGFLYVSPSCLDVTGYTAQDFYRDPSLIERIVHRDDRVRWDAYIEGVLCGKAPGGPGNMCEFRIVSQSSEVRWVQGLCHRIADEGGRDLGVRGSNRDITGLKKAEAEVKMLRGILPICAACKKVRDDKGYWYQVEEYIRDHSEAEFSHGLCPECARKMWPDMPDHLM